jgi:hypothetical protein
LKNLWTFQKWLTQFQKIRSHRTRLRNGPLQQPRSSLRPSQRSLRPREARGGLQEARTECLASSSPEFELNPFLEKSSPKQPLKRQRLKHPLRPVLWHPLRLVPALLSLLPLALYIARLLLNSSASETS